MIFPAKRKLTILKGARFDVGWTWTAGDTLVDLTGCSARLQVRPDVGSSEVLLELTTENGGIVLGGPAGTIDLWLGATKTAALTWESGVWSLEIQYPAGPDHVDRLLEGTITVLSEVVR